MNWADVSELRGGGKEKERSLTAWVAAGAEDEGIGNQRSGMEEIGNERDLKMKK